MSWLQGVAQLLDDLGIGVYDPDGAYAVDDVGITVETAPETPDAVIALYSQQGSNGHASIGLDYPILHVIVRHSSDPRQSRAIADTVYSALQGLGRTTLAGGTYLVLCHSDEGGPSTIGQDASGRHAHSLKFAMTLQKPTDHRP